jgi:hypothetical protein
LTQKDVKIIHSTVTGFIVKNASGLSKIPFKNIICVADENMEIWLSENERCIKRFSDLDLIGKEVRVFTDDKGMIYLSIIDRYLKSVEIQRLIDAKSYKSEVMV